MLGLLSVTIPTIMFVPKKYYDSFGFWLIQTGIESFSIYNVLCLAISGMLIGVIHPKSAWIYGAATILPFPIYAIAEMIKNPSSHNLFPFEFVFYSIMALPGMFGAETSSYIKRAIQKN